VPKHRRRFAGFNEAIVSLYAKGLTTGEIRAHLEIYGVEVFPATSSAGSPSTWPESWPNGSQGRWTGGGFQRWLRTSWCH